MATELEAIKPQRPMTHDLLRNFSLSSAPPSSRRR